MKLKHIFMTAVTGMALQACNYLDVVPDDTSTLDDAFETMTNAGNFIYGCYSVMPAFQDFRNNEAWCTTPEVIGSPHWTEEWFYFLTVQRSNFSPASGGSGLWANMYAGIRNCWIFLNNIDKTKPRNDSEAASFEKNKRQWIGEAYFLIGYYHFCLMQAYGPVVIADKLIGTDAPADEMQQPRRPYDECVDRVAAFLDKAMEYLPESYDESNLGRATKLAAQCIKARLYLYAASPLFNGNADYANFKNDAEYGGEQLVSTTYDAEKWNKALKEYETAIAMADKLGLKLYEMSESDLKTYSGGKTVTDFDRAVANSRYKIAAGWDSPELIWPYTGNKETLGGQGFAYHSILHGIIAGDPTGYPIGGMGTTLWTARLYQDKDGKMIDDRLDKEFDLAIDANDSIPHFNKNREPRYYADLGFDRGPYEITTENGLDTLTIRMRFKGLSGSGYYNETEVNGAKSNNTDQLYGGFAIKKMINPQDKVALNNSSVAAYPYPILRLAELYLGYAEAYVNYYGKLDGMAETYIDRVRSRAGLPGINTSYPGASKEELIAAVQRETTVEYMFEGHMFWDYRRWKLAKTAWAGMENGMIVLNVMGKTAEEFNTETRATSMPFIFKEGSYLYPIQQDYINKNPKIVQNPNW